MLKKIFFTLGIAILTSGFANAQNATIKGRVLEEDGKTPLEWANVRLMKDGEMILGASTDEKGNYSLTPVPTGTYTILVSFAGWDDYQEDGIIVRGSITKILEDIRMRRLTLEGVVISGKKPPMFEKDDATKVQYMDDKELKDMATRTVEGALATMSGVTVNASGGITVRANRGDPQYYVDGIPTSSVPTAAIGGFSLISGSIPAEYGDASAVIEIETKGPSSKVTGDFTLYTLVDGHAYVSLDAGSTGPIVKPKDKDGNERNYSIGYMVGLSAGYSKGPVYWKGMYRASQETIDYLKANPFRATEDLFSNIVDRNVDYVTKYQPGSDLCLEEKRSRQIQNAWSTSINIRPKIDIRTKKDMDFSIGGRFSYGTGRSFNFANSLFNSDNNPISESMGWEVNARFTHRLGGGSATKTDKKTSIIRNPYYRLIGYYIRSTGKTYSHIHKDNLFNYGYIGRFEHTLAPQYEIRSIDINGETWDDMEVQATVPRSIAISFTESDINPALSQYTVSAYERRGIFAKDEDIIEYKGLLNGDVPTPIYGDNMFSVPGLPYNGVSKSLSEKIGGRALVSFEIRNHAIRFGFDYDQSISRYYGISPAGLWLRMRNLTNAHIDELDLDNPQFVLDELGRPTRFVTFDRLVDAGNQSTFDRNIRDHLKKRDDDWIDIDSYDPSLFLLEWFSPEELLNGGYPFSGNGSTSSISYYGYDYTGKKTTNRSVTMADMRNWFDEGNPNNQTLRDISVIGAHKPIKMAAYIQDKFTVKSLYVQLGLRLDVFNLNQPYVKDMFLYREAYTVKEAQATNRLSDAYIPDFMQGSNDYYVYVRDENAPIVDIVAFRNEKTWYDKNGNEVNDPDLIVKSEGIESQLTPFLKEPIDALSAVTTRVHYKAFADYTPTYANGGITLSPRIAFSFAVGENSVFSASYNVITDWSSAVQTFNPVSYLFFEKFANQSNYIFNNPGLKPEKSINYEIGFKQLINPDMSMEFGAFYSERRDQVVAYQYSQAYPRTYFSYTNMDFTTVQGFMLGLNMRATNRISFRTNYTLQFAKGTGSDPNSTISLIRSGAPNLRTLTNLDDDQRHKLNLRITYAFGHKDGPRKVTQNKKGKVKEHYWLQNAGATLDLGAGSGLPYTRSSAAYSSILYQGARVVEGAINGSRMPWTIDGNLQIRKGFPLALKKRDDGTVEKSGMLQIALAIRNIIGYKNERQVYSYTGSRMDDGFLTAKEFQQYIANQENVASFIDYYQIRMEGLNPYGSPRTFELQVSFTFQ